MYSNIESADRQQLRELQSERLAATVRRVYERVPAYKKKMDEAGIRPEDITSVDDLYKLPFTTKKEFSENYPFGMFACDMGDVVRIHATSGTTGKQTVVGYTKNDIKIWGEAAARALSAAGATNKDLVHVAYGYGLFTGGLGMHNGVETLGATVVPAATGNTKRQVQLLRDFGSTVICCTPSYALYLAETMREEGLQIEDIKLKAGIFGAEPWSENMRCEIERALGLEAFDIYGLSEVMGPGVAWECSEHDGLHINEDFFIPEIIDPDTGKTLPDGQLGELVFTCVSKEALPLIRYRTRDLTSLTHERCRCGRTLARMERIVGRSDDMLIIRGVNVFPSQVEQVLLQLSAATPQYQIVVDRVGNLDTMTVLVELSGELFSDTVKDISNYERRIKKLLADTLGLTADVKLVEPKSFARSEGKAKRVVDNRKI